MYCGGENPTNVVPWCEAARDAAGLGARGRFQVAGGDASVDAALGQGGMEVRQPHLAKAHGDAGGGFGHRRYQVRSEYRKGTDGLLWITRSRPPGATAYAVVLVAASTALVLAIGVRSGIAIHRHQFLPTPAQHRTPPGQPQADAPTAAPGPVLSEG